VLFVSEKFVWTLISSVDMSLVPCLGDQRKREEARKQILDKVEKQFLYNAVAVFRNLRRASPFRAIIRLRIVEDTAVQKVKNTRSCNCIVLYSMQLYCIKCSLSLTLYLLVFENFF